MNLTACALRIQPNLPGDYSIWGSYYRNNPSVMIGNLQRASEIINTDPRLAKIAATYSNQTATVATAIRRK
ncbi:thermostable hemolysin [Shewanella dokdonensis]|uniref:Thermostable hemolysin n=1 Tax=Shewanella dokdonensis TaxID=712036 RepID=A0ABX8DEB6_9GAMM|nr:thermostable hemolysin [Shewanella dokdonensis]